MCIIILDNTFLKETTAEQLLTKLPEILYLLPNFQECFGSSEEALKTPCNQVSIYRK
jgi:hypothetical protein